MRLRWLSWLLLFVCAGCPAQTVIHHCVAANGTPVYSDQPCASLQDQPVMADDGTPAASTPIHGICPTTIDDLRRHLVRAMHGHDDNDLASLMQWRGYGQASALALMQRLHTLVNKPLLGIDINDLPPVLPAAATSTVTATTTAILTLHLGTAIATQDETFQVINRNGCLWLQP